MRMPNFWEQQEEVSNNPFAALGLGGLFRLKLYRSCKAVKSDG